MIRFGGAAAIGARGGLVVTRRKRPWRFFGDHIRVMTSTTAPAVVIECVVRTARRTRAHRQGAGPRRLLAQVVRARSASRRSPYRAEPSGDCATRKPDEPRRRPRRRATATSRETSSASASDYTSAFVFGFITLNPTPNPRAFPPLPPTTTTSRSALAKAAGGNHPHRPFTTPVATESGRTHRPPSRRPQHHDMPDTTSPSTPNTFVNSHASACCTSGSSGETEHRRDGRDVGAVDGSGRRCGWRDGEVVVLDVEVMLRAVGRCCARSAWRARSGRPRV